MTQHCAVMSDKLPVMHNSHLERGPASCDKSKWGKGVILRVEPFECWSSQRHNDLVLKFGDEKVEEGFGIFGTHNPCSALRHGPNPSMNWHLKNVKSPCR